MHLLEQAKQVGGVDNLAAFLQSALLCTCGCQPQQCDKAIAEESFPAHGAAHAGLDVVQILSELPPDTGRPEELSDYVMLRELGRGNFARVWLVRSTADDNEYALKIHNRRSMQQEQSVTATDTERRVLEKMCRHPFVVKLCRTFSSSASLYYVMEFCSGGNLAMRIRRCGRLDEVSLHFYGAETLLALYALHHENMVYKGLRPENILLDERGHIRLCDFSFAEEDVCDIAPSQNPGPGRKAGFIGEAPGLGFATSVAHHGLLAEYAAPELAEGYTYAKVADLYAYGVLLYECLVGRAPRRYSFDVAPSVDPPQDASPKAADLLRGLLHKQPGQRLGATRGAAEVQGHEFFGSVAWEDVLAMRLRPPFVPRDNRTTINCRNMVDEGPRSMPHRAPPPELMKTVGGKACGSGDNLGLTSTRRRTPATPELAGKACGINAGDISDVAVLDERQQRPMFAGPHSCVRDRSRAAASPSLAPSPQPA